MHPEDQRGVSAARLNPGKALAYEELTGRTAAIPIVEIKARALEKVLFNDGQERSCRSGIWLRHERNS